MTGMPVVPDGFVEGLEGVIAFTTEIAEPDKDGGALRYRGVDIEELVGRHPFEQVWGLLVDESFEPGMPRAERIAIGEPSVRPWRIHCHTCEREISAVAASSIRP